jgi:flagellar protein FliO/FliZ
MLRNSTSKQVSYGAAFLFAMIMLVGVTLMLISIPHEKPAIAVSQSVPDSTHILPQTSRDLSGTMYKVLWVTIVILAVIFFGARWYKKNILNEKMPNGTAMRIVSRQVIGHGQSLVIAHVEGKKILLGVTDHQINLLADLGELTEAEKNAAPRSPEFATILSKLRKGANESQ